MSQAFIQNLQPIDHTFGTVVDERFTAYKVA